MSEQHATSAVSTAQMLERLDELATALNEDGPHFHLERNNALPPPLGGGDFQHFARLLDWTAYSGTQFDVGDIPLLAPGSGLQLT